jgi:hypothetical protein
LESCVDWFSVIDVLGKEWQAVPNEKEISHGRVSWQARSCSFD